MPFKSRQQSKACFATGGFGGKVDCEEWAHKTNYKKLPKRKSFKEWLVQRKQIIDTDGNLQSPRRPGPPQ